MAHYHSGEFADLLSIEQMQIITLLPYIYDYEFNNNLNALKGLSKERLHIAMNNLKIRNLVESFDSTKSKEEFIDTFKILIS